MTGWWSDKAALVTGGARGQGAALVLQLLADGARVHVVDALPADDANWAALRAAARQHPGELREIRADIVEPALWDRLGRELADADRPLWGLVNNAGMTGPRNTVTNTQLPDWDRVMAVNVTAAMLAIRALALGMPRGASIVNVGSTTGLTGYYSAAYSCSKWALRGLTRSAAMDLAPRGVRVNCVCPGVVDTDMVRNSPPLLAALQNIIPMQQMARAEQIAQAVAWLLGPQSSYVTGTDLPVDGGVTGAGLYWPVGLATGAIDPTSRHAVAPADSFLRHVPQP